MIVGEVVDAAGDRHAVDLAAAQRRVVVDGHDRDQAELRALAHLAERGRAGAPGADDRDAHAALAVAEAAEREQPRLEADQAEQEGGDDRPGDEHRERDVLGAPREHQEQDDARRCAPAHSKRRASSMLAWRQVRPYPPHSPGREDVHHARRGQEHLERRRGTARAPRSRSAARRARCR